MWFTIPNTWKSVYKASSYYTTNVEHGISFVFQFGVDSRHHTASYILVNIRSNNCFLEPSYCVNQGLFANLAPGNVLPYIFDHSFACLSLFPPFWTLYTRIIHKCSQQTPVSIILMALIPHLIPANITLFYYQHNDDTYRSSSIMTFRYGNVSTNYPHY